jgi:hypothetical protein
VSAARLRLAAYNIAWFAKLFDRSNMLIEDDEWSALYGVTRRRQAGAIAQVLARIDADCIAVIEAPNSGRRQSCVAGLENFAARFGLRQRAALIGFENPTEQEIALLFDPDRISAEHAPVGEILSKAQARSNGKAGGLPWGVPRFDSIYPADLDGSGRVVLHEFSKPPLEAMVSDQVTGLTLRLIAVHLKSKAPHASGPAAKLKRIAHESRAKQYAQAAWLRARLSEHITAGESVIALGDFNDGPGYDHFEQAVGRSSVELAASRSRPGARPRRLRSVARRSRPSLPKWRPRWRARSVRETARAPASRCSPGRRKCPGWSSRARDESRDR